MGHSHLLIVHLEETAPRLLLDGLAGLIELLLDHVGTLARGHPPSCGRSLPCCDRGSGALLPRHIRLEAVAKAVATFRGADSQISYFSILKSAYSRRFRD